MFVYWGKHKGAIFHASAQDPKIPRADPRKRRKHLNAQSQKERSPFCRTSFQVTHTHIAMSPRSMCWSNTPRYAPINSEPRSCSERHRQVVHFRQEMHRKSSQGIASLLRGGPLYLVSFMACLRQIPECLHYPNPRRQSSRYPPSSPLTVSRRQSAHAGPMQPSSV